MAAGETQIVNELQAQVNYVPKILRNMAEICREMGVGEKMIRAWVEQGAPIAVEGQGKKLRYSAEVAALQSWRSGIMRVSSACFTDSTLERS